MKSVIVILFHLFPFFVVAQEKKDSSKIAKNTIFIEALGNGGFYSFNYDRIVFSKKQYAIAARFGLNYPLLFLDGGNNNKIKFSFFYGFLPIESVLLIKGSEKNNYFEVSNGLTLARLPMSIPNRNFGSDYEEIDVLAGYYVPRIGFRHQKLNGGFFLKLGIYGMIDLKFYKFNNEFKDLEQGNQIDIDYEELNKNNQPFVFVSLGLGYTFKVNDSKNK